MSEDTVKLKENEELCLKSHLRKVQELEQGKEEIVNYLINTVLTKTIKNQQLLPSLSGAFHGIFNSTYLFDLAYQ